MPSPRLPIRSDSTIQALLDAHPPAAPVLMRHGMACVGCAMADFETLAEAAREYQVDLSGLLEELAMVCRRGTEAPRKLVQREPRAPGSRGKGRRREDEP